MMYQIKVLLSTLKWYKNLQFLLNFANSFTVRIMTFLERNHEILIFTSKKAQS